MFLYLGGLNRFKCPGVHFIYLDDVNKEPLTDPKQDRPTNTGMIHAIGPRW